MSLPQTLVIAHRGASGYLPEHTLPAYRLALELGAKALEPDLVPTKDGVLVIRHENEISGTTDVAEHPEFAHLKTTKNYLGFEQTGWFVEDFTWDELSTLRCKERLPKLRQSNTRFDGKYPIMQLRELLELAQETNETSGFMPQLVFEIKHADYFVSLGFDMARLFIEECNKADWDHSYSIIESFELTVLRRLHLEGLDANLVFLLEAEGAPLDEIARLGAGARKYSSYLTEDALADLASWIDGVSVDKSMLFEDPDIVTRAQDAGLDVFTWTLRPENYFLQPEFRVGDDPTAFGNWEGEFRHIISTGVDAIFADHPDLALTALGY